MHSPSLFPFSSSSGKYHNHSSGEEDHGLFAANVNPTDKLALNSPEHQFMSGGGQQDFYSQSLSGGNSGNGRSLTGSNSSSSSNQPQLALELMRSQSDDLLLQNQQQAHSDGDHDSTPSSPGQPPLFPCPRCRSSNTALRIVKDKGFRSKSKSLKRPDKLKRSSSESVVVNSNQIAYYCRDCQMVWNNSVGQSSEMDGDEDVEGDSSETEIEEELDAGFATQDKLMLAELNVQAPYQSPAMTGMTAEAFFQLDNHVLDSADIKCTVCRESIGQVPCTMSFFNMLH
jgi:hypothetical protein